MDIVMKGVYVFKEIYIYMVRIMWFCWLLRSVFYVGDNNGRYNVIFYYWYEMKVYFEDKYVKINVLLKV